MQRLTNGSFTIIPSLLKLIVPRPNQSKKIFDGFGKHLVVRLLVLLGLELCTSLVDICGKDDIDLKPSKQFSAMVDQDARETFDFCTFYSNFTESLIFYRELP